MALQLQVPQQPDEFRPRICVVGVGGAGGNAINNMINSGLEGVEFLVANTDAQDLSQSLSDNRLQLGPTVTKGLGAGMQPLVGAEAAEESMDEILHRLDGANMVFITAGMGGGTGTGAAPVIAKALRERNILTVGVVTKPFQFEGMKRATFADEGIASLSESVDTLIVIPNQNLFRLANEKTTFADAFKMADNVLLDGVRGVSDLIVKPGIVNLDFADVRTLMTVMGKAMMGTGEAEGETRALDAAERAIANPLLDDMSLDGAQGVLINVTGGYDVTLYEVDAVANHVREKVDPEANIIFGSSVDESMTGTLRVSVVATGIDADQMRPRVTNAPNPQGTPPVNPGPSGGPGGGVPQNSPRGVAPTAAPAAPQSPFGRSPFAFRSNNRDQGPTSHYGENIGIETAPSENYDHNEISNNYAAVLPAQAAPKISLESDSSSSSLEQAADLFGAPARPVEDTANNAIGAPEPQKGGIFSRFAAAAAAPGPLSPPASAGAAAIAASQIDSRGNTAPEIDPEIRSEEAEPLLDLDASHSGGLELNEEPQHNEAGPRVLDIDDSAQSGLEGFDQSFKSVPAFLRQQNN
ncbi:MAG: cell division protein FtsZ [Alphaproteobacteria bacterium]